MLEFLDVFINNGFAGEMLETLINAVFYDNPLIIFLWVFILAFGLRVVSKALFG